MAVFIAPLLEFRPGIVARDADLIEIVHAGPAKMPVGHRKSGGLDNVGRDIQARAEAQNRACILGDVGLEKCNLHDVTTASGLHEMSG